MVYLLSFVLFLLFTIKLSKRPCISYELYLISYDSLTQKLCTTSHNTGCANYADRLIIFSASKNCARSISQKNFSQKKGFVFLIINYYKSSVISKDSLLSCLEAFWLLRFYFFSCSLQLIIIQIFLKELKIHFEIENR